MNMTVEERLQRYTTELDRAVADYAERSSRPSPDPRFPMPEPPLDRRSGRRRLAAALAVCLVAVASAGAVIAIARRGTPSPPAGTRPSVASTSIRPNPTTSHAASALDLDAVTAFGFGVGPGVDPETVRSTLTSRLGPPTRDTGWYVTQSLSPEDCLGGQVQRILRWGSLSYAFWKQTVSGSTQYVLWSWTLGDGGDIREPHPIVEQPVIPAATVDGVGVGTKLSVLQRIYGTRLQLADNQQSAVLGGTGAVTVFSLADGRVTGIVGRLSFC